ncbi:hypothetical protein DL98DRAFT_107591 [Cadophora sp. DSE1049]|nr:hypothetical protein DL98DRAFT_107591 [Cadophora sp. DSE1049]
MALNVKYRPIPTLRAIRKFKKQAQPRDRLSTPRFRSSLTLHLSCLTPTVLALFAILSTVERQTQTTSLMLAFLASRLTQRISLEALWGPLSFCLRNILGTRGKGSTYWRLYHRIRRRLATQPARGVVEERVWRWT